MRETDILNSMSFIKIPIFINGYLLETLKSLSNLIKHTDVSVDRVFKGAEIHLYIIVTLKVTC